MWVNDRLATSDLSINRWLEDNHRTWRAPRISLPTATGNATSVFLQLWEQDAPIRGDHDHTDTHPWDGRRDTALAYAPGTGDRTGQAVGGSQYGGRLGDGSKARLSWKLSTLDPGRRHHHPLAERRRPAGPAHHRLRPQRRHRDQLRDRAGGAVPRVG